jgi:hypothetical protein
MRKNLLTTLLLVVVCIASAQEQIPDAKKFYIKGGYTLKGKNYYGINDSKDTKLYDQYWKNRTLKGGNLELGSIFNIDQIKLGEKFGVGIDVNYLTINYMGQTFTEDANAEEKTYFLSVGSAVGPVFTYHANKSIAFDLFFKVNPIWLSADIITSTSKNNPDNTSGYLGFEGMKYKMGLNVRLDFFVISAEFNPGSVMLQNYDISEEYIGNKGERNDGELVISKNYKKTPLPVFNFNIGFCF